MELSPVIQAASALRSLRQAQDELARFRGQGGTRSLEKRPRAYFESKVCRAIDDYWVAEQALLDWADDIAYEQTTRSARKLKALMHSKPLWIVSVPPEGGAAEITPLDRGGSQC